MNLLVEAHSISFLFLELILFLHNADVALDIIGEFLRLWSCLVFDFSGAAEHLLHCCSFEVHVSQHRLRLCIASLAKGKLASACAVRSLPGY